jgi:hypothetical protein
MLEYLPGYIVLVFLLTTVSTIVFFVWIVAHTPAANARKQAACVGVFLLTWVVLQGFLSAKGIYVNRPDALPPTIAVFGILPPLMVVIGLFATKAGRQFVDSLSLVSLTYLHLVRVPVECVLYWLFLYKTVPQLMTFSGRNFDIFAGLTAPILAYFLPKIKSKWVVAWHVVGLALLINIVINALLSAPSPLQVFAFDQPNVAILHFPFSWLPTFIVPLVLLCHLVAFRQAFQKKDTLYISGLKQK